MTGSDVQQSVAAERSIDEIEQQMIDMISPSSDTTEPNDNAKKIEASDDSTVNSEENHKASAEKEAALVAVAPIAAAELHPSEKVPEQQPAEIVDVVSDGESKMHREDPSPQLAIGNIEGSKTGTTPLPSKSRNEIVKEIDEQLLGVINRKRGSEEDPEQDDSDSTSE
jgi:hypothetical protein